MLVRITNEKSELLAVTRRITTVETDGWQRQTIDFSRSPDGLRRLHVKSAPSLIPTFYLDDVVLKRN